MFINLSSPVPQPAVVITRSHSGSVYAGTEFTLSADISFSDLSGVDVDISLDISWNRGSDVIENSTVTTFFAVSGSGDSYTASLNYSPTITSDSGLITATVTVRPVESVFIQMVMANDTEMLTIEGMHKYWQYCLNNYTTAIFCVIIIPFLLQISLIQ